MENGEDKTDEHLATTQEATEVVAGKVAHCTKAEREHFFDKHQIM